MKARLADRIAATRDSLRELSLRQVVRRLAFRRIESLVYARPLGGSIVLPLPAGMELRVATPDQPSRFNAIDERLSPRRRCYVVVRGDEIAHVSWLITSPPTALATGLPVGTPVIGESTTPPAYRGQGLYPFVLQAIAADANVTSPDGNAYVFVEPSNGASISGIRRAGFHLVSHATLVRVLGLVVWKRVHGAD